VTHGNACIFVSVCGARCTTWRLFRSRIVCGSPRGRVKSKKTERRTPPHTLGVKLHARVAKVRASQPTSQRFGADGGGFLLLHPQRVVCGSAARSSHPRACMRIFLILILMVVAFSPLPAFDAAISAASSSRPTHRCLGRLVDWEIIISSATGADCHLRRDQNTRLELRPHAALSPAAAIRLFSWQRTAPLTLNPLSLMSLKLQILPFLYAAFVAY
jgi:hypothetical protein